MHGCLKRDFRYSKKGWMSAWTSEKGLPLFKEGVVECMDLLRRTAFIQRRGGRVFPLCCSLFCCQRLQQQEGFLPEGV